MKACFAASLNYGGVLDGHHELRRAVPSGDGRRKLLLRKLIGLAHGREVRLH
jgi:hypothetical protein